MGKILLCDNPFCREFELTDYDLVMLEAVAKQIDIEDEREETFEKILSNPCECDEDTCKELVQYLERMPLMNKISAYNNSRDALPYNETFGKFQDRLTGFIAYLQVCRGFTDTKKEEQNGNDS